MKVLDTAQFVSERIKLRPVTNAELDQIQQDMNTNKYELTDETIKTLDGKTLHHIKALKDIPSKKVKKGDLGGWIESYNNLDQKGDCWVADNAWVCENAKVYGNAKVFEYARVYGNAKVCGDAYVYGDAAVYDTAEVYGNAEVYSFAKVLGKAKVYENADVFGNVEVYGYARVYGYAKVYGNAEVDYDVKDENIDK